MKLGTPVLFLILKEMPSIFTIENILFEVDYVCLHCSCEFYLVPWFAHIYLSSHFVSFLLCSLLSSCYRVIGTLASLNFGRWRWSGGLCRLLGGSEFFLLSHMQDHVKGCVLRSLKLRVILGSLNSDRMRYVAFFSGCLAWGIPVLEPLGYWV